MVGMALTTQVRFVLWLWLVLCNMCVPLHSPSQVAQQTSRSLQGGLRKLEVFVLHGEAALTAPTVHTRVSCCISLQAGTQSQYELFGVCGYCSALAAKSRQSAMGA